MVFEGWKLSVTACLHTVSPCAVSCGKLIKLLNATLCHSSLLQGTYFYSDSCCFLAWRESLFVQEIPHLKFCHLVSGILGCNSVPAVCVPR